MAIVVATTSSVRTENCRHLLARLIFDRCDSLIVCVCEVGAEVIRLLEPHNVNVHRAAAKDMQAEKAARPAAPCATYCYHAFSFEEQRIHSHAGCLWFR